MLPYFVGTGSTSYPASARSVRIGGNDSSFGVGNSAFWTPDGVSGIEGPYAAANQRLAGNTALGPRMASGFKLTHNGLQVPLAWVPGVSEPGDLGALPYNYRYRFEVVLAKDAAGGVGTMFVGWENPNAGSIFTNSQGSLGLGVWAAGTGTILSGMYARTNADIAGVPFNPPSTAAGIDCSTNPIRIRWTITVGTIWVAECEVNGSLVGSYSNTDLPWSNLNLLTGSNGRFWYPTIYSGSTVIRGPLWSRATAQLVTP